VTRRRAPSPQAVSVLTALSADPSRWRYGYELGTEVGLRSGSLYPILMRLEDRGLLEAMWEQTTPGKPPRHLYRLTAAGLLEATALSPARQTGRARVVRPELRGA
jgi:DNA-binding PadR family transcriptional regulator